MSKQSLLETIRDSPSAKVIRRQLHKHAVAGKYLYVMLPHLAGDVRQYDVSVGQFHPEHSVRQTQRDLAFDLNLLFLRHNPGPTPAPRGRLS